MLHNALANIAAEMALVMMKTSYSTIFNEGLDFTTVLLDRRGDLIAEKNYTPSMMGAIPHTVQWTLEEFGEEFFEPGDVVVHNDPYRGNCHLPEHMMMKPIFRGRRADRVRREHRPYRRGRRESRPAASPPTPPTSTRRACGCRPSS